MTQANIGPNPTAQAGAEQELVLAPADRPQQVPVGAEQGAGPGAEDREAGSHKRMLDDFNLRVVCSGSHNFLASLTQIILELYSRALPLLFADYGDEKRNHCRAQPAPC